jgi:uncharacterized protein
MDSGIIFKNKILDVVFVSMVVAQLYKLVSTSILQKKMSWSRLWNTGGMPSSHSSSVVALATCIGFTEGLGSAMFAISVVFSIIVMYDASGIRKAAGEHAGILNQFTEFFNTVFEKKFKHENLKELLGHSRSEVLAGAVLGFLIAFFMKGYLLK